MEDRVDVMKRLDHPDYEYVAIQGLKGKARIPTDDPRLSQGSWYCFWNVENCYSPIKKHRMKVHRYQKDDYESVRADALKFAKEKYFNGYSYTRSVHLITSFIQDSADTL